MEQETSVTSRARVLFVDDEPHLLAGLRRNLHTRGVGWQIASPPPAPKHSTS
ncbi:MAG: hypothetical protein IPJ14_07255 [Kineosporiaceae bacterium]|nr:hypothetical protein [Kineosporiaceae bacterium]